MKSRIQNSVEKKIYHCGSPQIILASGFWILDSAFHSEFCSSSSFIVYTGAPNRLKGSTLG